MDNEVITQAVAIAVQQAYDKWAIEHPSLATVIDQVVLTERIVESLRDSDAYHQAVIAYHQGRNELDLLNRLIDLAGPILRGLLTE